MSKGRIRGWLIGALALLAGPVLAQGLPPVAAPASELPRVLPVWSTTSGRVEAILLVDDATAERGPAASVFSNSALSSLFSTPGSANLGLHTEARLSPSLSLSADLGFGGTPALGLLCEGNVGIAAALGRLSDQCLLARLDGETGAVDGWQQSFGLSGRWQADDGDVDLSFGLSWLEADIGTESLFDAPSMLAGVDAMPPLVGSGLQFGQQELTLQASRWIGPRSWVRVEGRHGRARLGGIEVSSLFGLPNEWDSSSLSLSGGYRGFSGNITGRLIELEQPRKRWTDLDISVSWKMPWDARLSVGAKNLLGGPRGEDWPMSSLPGMSENEARTPYVRYHQDL